MKIDVFEHNDNWQEIKNATMNTIGKNTGTYPTLFVIKLVLSIGYLPKGLTEQELIEMNYHKAH